MKSNDTTKDNSELDSSWELIDNKDIDKNDEILLVQEVNAQKTYADAVKNKPSKQNGLGQGWVELVRKNPTGELSK